MKWVRTNEVAEAWGVHRSRVPVRMAACGVDPRKIKGGRLEWPQAAIAKARPGKRGRPKIRVR